MLPPNCCHPAALNVATQLLPPSRAKCCLAIVATQLLPPSRTKCCQPNVASHETTTTRRRRRDDDDDDATTRTRRRRRRVAAAPRCPHRRCRSQVPSQSLQPPSGRCSLCGHSPQALPVSWAPCNPSSRCSPLTPHSVAAAPRRPSVTAPKRTLTVAAASWAPCSPRPHCSPSLLIHEDG